MRKALFIASLGLLLAMGASNAAADTITTGNLSFTCLGGDCLLPTAGSFVFDNTTNQFLNLTVDWDGFHFVTFLSESVQGPVGGQILVPDPTVQGTIFLELIGSGPLPLRWEGVCGTAPALPSVFCDTTAFDFHDQAIRVIDFQNPGTLPEFMPAGGAGIVTATDLVTTPEPGATGLLLLGIGILFAVKKRAN